MKGHALILLALLGSTHTMAQEEAYKGNPHIILPDDKPAVSIPFDQQHITLPFPDSQVTNLFTKGYQTVDGAVVMLRICSRKAPERIHYAKIGDFVGSYRINRMEIDGRQYALYLVNSNETVVIRAHQAKDTPLNSIEPLASPNRTKENE